MSNEQNDIYSEICLGDESFEEFLDLIRLSRIVKDENVIPELAQEITGSWDAGAAAATPPETPREPSPEDLPPVTAEITPELDWFCFYAVLEGLLNNVTARRLLSGADGRPELVTFAQSIVDNGICSDYEWIQDLVDRAVQQVGANKLPPYSVFKDEAAA